jgi:lactate permease
MGKMIDAQSDRGGLDRNQLVRPRGLDPARYVFLHWIVLACLVGLFVTLQAYVYLFAAMVISHPALFAATKALTFKAIQNG